MDSPDDKLPTEVQHSEHSQLPGPSRQNGQSSKKGADRALAIIGDQKIEVSEEENRRILRKTDRVILVILVWVYFLQILVRNSLMPSFRLNIWDQSNEQRINPCWDLARHMGSKKTRTSAVDNTLSLGLSAQSPS